MTQTINWSALTSKQRDQLIAEKLFGWQPIPCDSELTVYDDGDAWCPGCQARDHTSTIEHGIIAPPTYTTSIDAAWLVVERSTRLPRSHAESLQSVNASFAFWWEKAELWACSAEEAAKEICIAALRMRGYTIVEEQA